MLEWNQFSTKSTYALSSRAEREPKLFNIPLLQFFLALLLHAYAHPDG